MSVVDATRETLVHFDKEREDVLNIGGFSDAVFSLVAEFAEGRLSDGHWVSVIEAVTL